MATKVQQYLDAVAAWRKACDEIDQAHAVLRDIGLHKYHTGYGSLSADSLVDRAGQLLKSLEELACDDCGEPVATHAGTDCPYWE
jgi:hypothetical protein